MNKSEYEWMDELVMSAMSGNGTLPVNNKIRDYLSVLKEKYNYSYHDLKGLTTDIVIYLLSEDDKGKRPIDSFNKEKAGMQTFVNLKVLGYLTLHIRSLEREAKMKSDLANIMDFSHGESKSPEDMLILKEFLEILNKADSNWEVYLDIYNRTISKSEAMRELGMTWGTLRRRYEAFCKTIEDYNSSNYKSKQM